MDKVFLNDKHLEILSHVFKEFGFNAALEPMQMRWHQMNQYQRRKLWDHWAEFRQRQSMTIFSNGRARTFAAVKLLGVPQCSG